MYFDPVRAKREGRPPNWMDAETAGLFPDRLEETRVGLIPSGWTISTIGDFCELITDGSHHSPASVDNGLPMASVKDLTDWGIDLGTCRRISSADFDRLVASGCQPRAGDILLAKDGAYCLQTVCEYTQPEDIVLLSSIAILRPKQTSAAAYLDLWFKQGSTKTYLIEGFRSGSAIPRVVLKDLKRAQLITPGPNLIEAFLRAVGPLRDQIRLNIASDGTLAALRDALLPKLLSGEIRVKDAEAAAREVG